MLGADFSLDTQLDFDISDFRSNHFFPVLDQSPIYKHDGSMYGLIKFVLIRRRGIWIRFEGFQGSLYSFW